MGLQPDKQVSPWSKSVDEVLRALETDAVSGLDEKEAIQRQTHLDVFPHRTIPVLNDLYFC